MITPAGIGTIVGFNSGNEYLVLIHKKDMSQEQAEQIKGKFVYKLFHGSKLVTVLEKQPLTQK